MIKLLGTIALTLAYSASLMGTEPPRVGDTYEVGPNGGVNVRSGTNFFNSPILTTLRPGTQFRVVETRPTRVDGRLTGSLALRIECIETSDQCRLNNAAWVLYNRTNPSITPQNRTPLRRANSGTGAQRTGAQENSAPRARADSPGEQDTPADLRRAAETATRLTAVVGTAATGPNPRPCADCQQGTPQQRSARNYQECSARNNYIERQMDEVLTGARRQLAPTLQPLLQNRPEYANLRSCVVESIHLSSARYAFCEGGQGNVLTRGKPCISERFTQVSENAFALTADCFKDLISPNEDRRQYFRNLVSLINLESGFIFNAQSPTGSSGLGQITQGAIQAANRAPRAGAASSWNEFISHMNQSNSPACQSLRQTNPQPMDGRRSMMCERTTLPNGPVSNMIYALAHQRGVRRQITASVNREMAQSRLNLSSENKEALISALTLWGHNTGAAGINTPSVALMRSESGRRLLAAGNINGFLATLRTVVERDTFRRNNSTAESASPRIRARAREASSFYSHVQTKMRRLEQQSGGRQCTI